MSGFKDMVADDVHAVFLNLDEFAEKRTIRYDGEEHQDIPIVLSGLKEQERRQLPVRPCSRDSTSCHPCSTVPLSDLGGNQPEKGMRIQINNREGGGGFFREFYVASSVCEMGMLAGGIGGDRRMKYLMVMLDEIDDSLDRVSKLLAGIPDGVYRAVGSALKRSAQHRPHCRDKDSDRKICYLSRRTESPDEEHQHHP